MDFKPRPVPPIYHPRIVVDAILYAAENPVRDLIAGAAGVGVVYAERISPHLADWVSGAIGFIGQTKKEESDGKFQGNLFEPISGTDTVEGSFSDEQLKSDPYTWLKTHPKAQNTLLALAGGLIGGALAWRAFKDKEEK